MPAVLSSIAAARQIATARWACCLLVAATATLPGSLTAQEVQRGTSIRKLPRPGYEARQVTLGRIVLSPEIFSDIQYDSNVFAASTDVDDDVVATVRPTLVADYDQGGLQLRSDGYLSLQRYADNDSESSTTFGLGTAAAYVPDLSSRAGGSLRFDRAVESRADPEATIVRGRHPAKIDSFAAEANYRYRPNRIGFSLQAGASRTNYLPAEDADRDLTSYRGSVRLMARATPRLDLFVEPFVSWRDNDEPVDRSGFDRDSRTVGALAGVAVDIADRWQGQIGVGGFRANPGDPSFRSFSGLSFNGNLDWSPDERTTVSLSLFRGDVATIRGGATGRIDTRVGLQVDQELRHDLLFHAGVAFRRTSYRGTAIRDQNLMSGEVQLEYLLNRHVSLVATVGHADRSADVESDRFKRSYAGLGLRLTY